MTTAQSSRATSTAITFWLVESQALESQTLSASSSRTLQHLGMSRSMALIPSVSSWGCGEIAFQVWSWGTTLAKPSRYSKCFTNSLQSEPSTYPTPAKRHSYQVSDSHGLCSWSMSGQRWPPAGQRRNATLPTTFCVDTSVLGGPSDARRFSAHNGRRAMSSMSEHEHCSTTDSHCDAEIDTRPRRSSVREPLTRKTLLEQQSAERCGPTVAHQNTFSSLRLVIIWRSRTLVPGLGPQSRRSVLNEVLRLIECRPIEVKRSLLLNGKRQGPDTSLR